MSSGINPADLGDELHRVLTIYGDNVAEAVNDRAKKSAKKLLRKTKATAPVGRRGGAFKRALAVKEVDAGHGMKEYVWHAKPPEHRLVHLLVHGHATKDGGRTAPDPFLENALAEVLPEFEHDVEEVLRNGG